MHAYKFKEHSKKLAVTAALLKHLHSTLKHETVPSCSYPLDFIHKEHILPSVLSTALLFTTTVISVIQPVSTNVLQVYLFVAARFVLWGLPHWQCWHFAAIRLVYMCDTAVLLSAYFCIAYDTGCSDFHVL